MIATVAIADELLTESAAVARIPGRDSEVRAWLQNAVRPRRGPTGIRLYRWAEILAALPEEGEPPPPTPKARSGTLPRARL